MRWTHLVFSDRSREPISDVLKTLNKIRSLLRSPEGIHSLAVILEYLLGSSKKKLDTSYVAKKLSPKDFKFLVTNSILRKEETRFVFDPLFVKIILLIEKNNNLYERMVEFSLSGSGSDDDGSEVETLTSGFESDEESEESENQALEPVIFMDSKRLYQEFAHEFATLDVETLFFWNSETNMYSNPEAIPDSEFDSGLGLETLNFLRSLEWPK
jgi:hypothetical protein